MIATRVPLFTGLFLALAACAPQMGPPGPFMPEPPPPPPVEPASAPGVFRAGEFAWSAIPGTNRIEGRLVYRMGPTSYTCSGDRAGVVLMPETPWSRDRMMTLYRSSLGAIYPAEEVRERTPPAPQGLGPFIRSAPCDSQNRFVFSGLPDGSWFIISVARPSAGPGQEMAIMRRVTTRGGRATVVDL